MSGTPVSETQLVAQAKEDLARLFDRHRFAALAFSGGKDSSVMLDLCAPYRDRIAVLWVNTGFMFPHMESFVRHAAANWNFVELPSDMLAYWNAFGIPSTVVPTDHAVGGMGTPKTPRINSWPLCCWTLRMRPMVAWLAANPAVTALIHSQRDSDYGRFDCAQLQANFSAEFLTPIWQWSDEGVRSYIAEHDIQLPEQYAMGWHDSGECWPCTARLTPRRMAYMRQRYPEQAAIVERHAREIYRVAMDAASQELEAFK
jgi:3'-phosphoadenosine 5'-phosphosulfate sulfotransferase (PAPS reductase)/FAD synthetase